MNTFERYNDFLRMFRSRSALVAIILFSACTGSDDDDTALLGEWYVKSSLDGVGRSGAVVVTIGDRAYMGTGYDGSRWLKDWWEYDPSRDFWVRKSDFPGAARSSAVAFTLDGKAYVGTGYNGTDPLKDFWAYDPVADEWSQASEIADFEGTARYGAVAFAVDGKGYVGTGYDGNYLKDVWEYNATENDWIQKVSVGGSKRINAFSFVINGRAFVGGGKNNGVLNQDLWEFDAEGDSWTAKTDLDENDYSISRELTSAFVINGLGYIACGTISSINNEVWEYDPSDDTWTQKTSFEGSAREGAIGFAVGTMGYICTGRSSGLRYDDLWQFDPSAEDTD